MTNNSTDAQPKPNLLRRFTKFMQSSVGVTIIAISYLILHLPVELSTYSLRYMAGEVAAKLLTTAIVVFVLARFFKWTTNQMILAILLLSFLFEIMQTQELFAPVVRIVILLSLPTLIIQFVFEAGKKKSTGEKKGGGK